MSDLPTKPGPYYWREKDGDAWEICIVETNDDGELCALLDDDVFWVPVKEKANLQWLPIPTAEELVELKAKAKMVGDGFDGWAIYDHDGLLVVIDPAEPGAPFSGEIKDGYTCRKVRVCNEVENKKGTE